MQTRLDPQMLASLTKQEALNQNAAGSTFFKGKREVLGLPKPRGRSVTILKQFL